MDVSPAWPAHVAGDIGILACETANQAVTENTSGWTEFSSSPQGTGTAGAAGATRLTLWWKRAASSAEANANITGVTDHKVAVIITFRGCLTSGDPTNALNGGVDATSDTSLNAVGPTSTTDECLGVVFATTDTDSATPRWSTQADTSLTDVTERFDQSSSTGNGGGIGCFTGWQEFLGDMGTMTATAATATRKGWIFLALAPQLGVTQPNGAGTTIYIYDDASSASTTAFSPSEIASAFPADFVQIEGGTTEDYNINVDVQIGDDGLGSKATTLSAINTSLHWVTGKTLLTRQTQIASWGGAFGTQIAGFPDVSGVDGCNLNFGGATRISGHFVFSACRIVADSGALEFIPEGAYQFYDCIIENAGSGAGDTIAFGDSVAQTAISTLIHTKVSGNTTGVLMPYCSISDSVSMTVTGNPSSFMDIPGFGVDLIKLSLVGTPSASDVLISGANVNARFQQPNWSQLGPRVSFTAQNEVGTGLSEQWLFDHKIVDASGDPIAGIQATLSDSIGTVWISQVSDSEGRVTGGSGQAVTVRDHYSDSSLNYLTRDRSPFTVVYNSPSSPNYNSNYLSRTRVFDWPGLSTGIFADVLDIVSLNEPDSATPTPWVECSL